MEKIKILPKVVAGQDVSGRRVGRLRWVGRVAVLVAGVVGMVTAAAPTATAHQVTISGGRSINADAVNYVALGDSYSAGLGTGAYDAASGACARSPLSYPPLWAAEHRAATLGFAACSGAKTADVRIDQISALQPSTDLVTITVGGNDAGFGTVLRTCTFAENDRTCFVAVNATEAFARSALRDRLARTYTEIRRAAPHAQVIVLGYPRVFDLAPSCADPRVPNLARRHKLNEGSDVLNDVIQSVSQQFGFGFSDVRGRFADHGVCSADPWINGPSVSTFIGPYHPNQTGYRDGYLNALDAATARGVEAD